jgi:lactam utilization protein B
LHGDGPHALAFAQKLRRMLEANGIDVQPASSLPH